MRRCENYGDRLILNDVLLRGDHDTLLMYGPAFGAGPGPSRVYVHDSHIQGRGDFIASFSSVFIENSVLETIRDRSHFLYQLGVIGQGPAEQDALVVRKTRFTGQSRHPSWPAGVTNLSANARVYLLRNVFEFNVGANRQVAHFHASSEPHSSSVMHYGNTQSRSTRSPLVWSSYSVPGPQGTPRWSVSSSRNVFGEPIVQPLTQATADRITPLWLFRDWNPRTAEPRSACEDGVDNDGRRTNGPGRRRRGLRLAERFQRDRADPGNRLALRAGSGACPGDSTPPAGAASRSHRSLRGRRDPQRASRMGGARDTASPAAGDRSSLWNRPLFCLDGC